jgi:hypothetical protein
MFFFVKILAILTQNAPIHAQKYPYTLLLKKVQM